MISVKITVLLLFLFHEVHASWQHDFLEKVRRRERPDWMVEQIAKDLQPFAERGITKSDLAEALKRLPNRSLRFEIKNKAVTLLSDVEIAPDLVGQLQVLRDFLNQLVKLVALPYLDFIISADDATHYMLEFVGYQGPIFSFGKLENAKGTILFPDWHVINSGQSHKLCYEDALKQTARAKRAYPWHRKIDKAFWRGSNTGIVLEKSWNLNNFDFFPRNLLVQFSLIHPDLLDARFVGLCCGDAELRNFLIGGGFLGDHASILEHLKYKYQILVDGHSCSWAGGYWRFWSDSVVIKHTSPAIQWYYGVLKPFVHYIPVAYDFSDLEEKIHWARSHDSEVQQIIKNANAMAKSVLKYEDIVLYIYLLLTEYAKLQRF